MRNCSSNNDCPIGHLQLPQHTLAALRELDVHTIDQLIMRLRSRARHPGMCGGTDWLEVRRSLLAWFRAAAVPLPPDLPRILRRLDDLAGVAILPMPISDAPHHPLVRLRRGWSPREQRYGFQVRRISRLRLPASFSLGAAPK